jgi:hypothetical protein
MQNHKMKNIYFELFPKIDCFIIVFILLCYLFCRFPVYEKNAKQTFLVYLRHYKETQILRIDSQEWSKSVQSPKRII